jgi:hypothetical protein
LEKGNLKEVYGSYTLRIANLLTASVTGKFILRSAERTANDLRQLALLESTEAELEAVLKQAKKETQLNTQLFLNKQVQRCRAAIVHLRNGLLTD